MRGFNLVVIGGNAGGDAELRHTQNGQAVANFNLAVNESFGGGEGQQRQERTTWVRCVCWQKTAEIAAQFVKKGTGVLVQGRVQNRDWTDRDGNRREQTEVVVSSLTLLDRPPQNGTAQPAAPRSQAPAQTPAQTPAPNPESYFPGQMQAPPAAPAPAQAAAMFPDPDDDLPF